MESNLIHFIDELRRIKLNLLGKKKPLPDRIKTSLLRKQDEIIGKIDLLPVVNSLYKIYFHNEKGTPMYFTMIKATTIYEVEFFAKYLAGKSNLKYHHITYEEISTAKLVKVN